MASGQKVLVADDGSESADAAIDTAAALFGDRPLDVLSVGHSLASAAAGVAGLPAGAAGDAVTRLDEAAQQESESLAERGAQVARERARRPLRGAPLRRARVGGHRPRGGREPRCGDHRRIARTLWGEVGAPRQRLETQSSTRPGRPVLVVPGPSADAAPDL